MNATAQKNDTFVSFMDKRAHEIENGKIKKLPAAMLAHVNRKEIDKTVQVAQNEARADKSDPFAYRRAMSHMLSGITSRSDYEVTFGRSHVPSRLFPERGEITVDLPMNRSIPCI